MGFSDILFPLWLSLPAKLILFIKTRPGHPCRGESRSIGSAPCAWMERTPTMADTYKSFHELQSLEREGEDWAREYIDRGSPLLIMAPHGGWIEPFTTEVARAVAGDDLSFYTFLGLKESGNHTLHLTSHRFDEPLAQRAASSARWILTIHGERSSDRAFVMVGGLWRSFRRALVRAFEEAGIRVEGPREGLAGVNPKNICNCGQAGAGGQLEISGGLRRALRQDPAGLARFAGVVRSALFHVEREGIVAESHGGRIGDLGRGRPPEGTSR